jgi:hypothetical protein
VACFAVVLMALAGSNFFSVSKTDLPDVLYLTQTLLFEEMEIHIHGRERLSTVAEFVVVGASKNCTVQKFLARAPKEPMVRLKRCRFPSKQPVHQNSRVLNSPCFDLSDLIVLHCAAGSTRICFWPMSRFIAHGKWTLEYWRSSRSQQELGRMICSQILTPEDKRAMT